MKGKLGALMLVLLVVSYFLDKQFGHAAKTKEDTGIVIVTGQVTNRENGNAVVKATIEIQGTPTKTFTGDKGEYSIPCKKGDQLIASHPKYKRISVEITEDTQDILLTPKNSELTDKLKADFPEMELVE
ncbi:carboxypeptidase-like regulatory domain-containing protein [Viscerimonas tarda]